MGTPLLPAERRQALETVVDLATGGAVGSAGRGLPNAHYVDPETHRIESQALFFNTWAAIGFAKDCQEPGMAIPIDLLGIPLVMVRGEDGELRVFQNVCRHRGMILVDEPTKLKGAIRCKYHSWCYNQTGELAITPHVGGPGQNADPEIDRSELGLIKVRSAVWMDIVFVNISGAAPDFEAHIAPLAARWKDFTNRPLFHGGPSSSFKLEVQTNWKLAVENYCESYHLPWIHPGLNSYSRLEDHYNIVQTHDTAVEFSGQGTLVYNPQLDPSGRSFANFENLPAVWDKQAEYISLYPNLLLGVHRDHTYAILLEAKSQTQTVEHVEIYYTSEEMTSEAWEDLRTANAKLWKDIFIEDIEVVEGMQRGRSAPDFDGGRFSPKMDASTQAFHAWAAKKVLQTQHGLADEPHQD